jgi:hypothetical protein
MRSRIAWKFLGMAIFVRAKLRACGKRPDIGPYSDDCRLNQGGQNAEETKCFIEGIDREGRR